MATDMLEQSSHPVNNNVGNVIVLDSKEVVAEGDKIVDEVKCKDKVEEQKVEDEKFETKKRKKTSAVWDEFHVEGEGDALKDVCNHCNHSYDKVKSGPTSHLLRHLNKCLKRKISLRATKQQTRLNFLPSDSALVTPGLLYGKFDMEQMREGAAHWIMMHEHPFAILEEEGFNLMMRRGMPEWTRISRNTCKTDCLTTDCWKSKNQRIEYMVVTGHWVDSSWNLQKRVLSFFNIPPPRGGLQISDTIFKCMSDWGISKKVFSITVDNA